MATSHAGPSDPRPSPSIQVSALAATADFVGTEARSRIMRAVRQRDTSAERQVRSILRRLGASYRTCVRSLPGSPDIANRRRRWAVFVQGCFWHGHKNCPKTHSRSHPRVPVANSEHWGRKLRDNRARDAKKVHALRRLGFRVALVWECELARPGDLSARLESWLARSQS